MLENVEILRKMFNYESSFNFVENFLSFIFLGGLVILFILFLIGLGKLIFKSFKSLIERVSTSVYSIRVTNLEDSSEEIVKVRSSSTNLAIKKVEDELSENFTWIVSSNTIQRRRRSTKFFSSSTVGKFFRKRIRLS